MIIYGSKEKPYSIRFTITEIPNPWAIKLVDLNKDGKDYLIDELPIGVCTDKYKEFLEGLLESKKLKSLKNYVYKLVN